MKMIGYLNQIEKGETDTDIARLLKENFSSLKAEEFLIFSFGIQIPTAIDVSGT